MATITTIYVFIRDFFNIFWLLTLVIQCYLFYIIIIYLIKLQIAQKVQNYARNIANKI